MDDKISPVNLTGMTTPAKAKGGKKKSEEPKPQADSFAKSEADGIPSKKEVEKLFLNGPGKKAHGSTASCGGYSRPSRSSCGGYSRPSPPSCGGTTKPRRPSRPSCGGSYYPSRPSCGGGSYRPSRPRC